MMMRVAVGLDAERAVVRADFAKNAAGQKNVDVFVYGSERNCRHPLLDLDEYVLWTWVPMHRLHDLVDHLPLVGHSKPLLVT